MEEVGKGTAWKRYGSFESGNVGDADMILGDMYDTSCRRRERWMQAILSRRRQEGTLREMRTVERDRCFIDFTSNDYLGLGRSTELLRSIEKEEARVLKVKSGTLNCTSSSSILDSFAVLVVFNGLSALSALYQ